MIDKSKVIMVDTREQKNHVTDYMNHHGIANIRSKLYVGDYARLDNQSLAIDRKQHLSEVCSNLCQQHERFRAELLRAQQAGIRMIILVEHGHGVKTLDDVKGWVNPRLKKSPYALSGEGLYKRMCTIRDKYGVEWMFCEKRRTGQTVCELLGIVIKK
jgi:hypothetical protein